MMDDHRMTPRGPVPAASALWSLLRERSNWGRWGDDDQVGAPNLLTGDKVRAAAGLVRNGKTLSLSRPLPTAPSAANPFPAQHMVMTPVLRRSGGMVLDYYGSAYHGLTTTHIDALCHVWDQDGIWGGREPRDVISHDGVSWAGIEHWADGLVTRGVIFDVPRYRGTDYVDIDHPVHGWELEAIAQECELGVQPGDALVIYSGRDSWSRNVAEWGSGQGAAESHGADCVPRAGLVENQTRPGLHASCLEYIRSTDSSILVWDMMDVTPIGYDELAWSVHAAIWAFGVALVDNAFLEPLIYQCREARRHDFLLVVAPLKVVGGTGSPVNPIAIL